MNLFVPAKWLNNQDFTLALSSLQKLVENLTPKHLKLIQIKMPLRAEQEGIYHEFGQLPFQHLDTDLLTTPKEGSIVFYPAQQDWVAQVRHMNMPVISFRNEVLENQMSSGAVMLVERTEANPVKVFAVTLQMLYFDPGARRMMFQNLKQFQERKTSSFSSGAWSSSLSFS